jgi:hypothetical protein
MFDTSASGVRRPRSTSTVPAVHLDRALTAQFVVAWAGESGDPKRLGWWQSDLISPYGGRDLFRRLLPKTAEWAVLQAAREAARRTDAEMRRRDHDPDRILSLFRLGFELDERLEERLQDLKQSGRGPYEALPGLAPAITPVWDAGRFLQWIQTHGNIKTDATPSGRRIAGSPSADLDDLVRRLVAALAPLGDSYSLPHFRSAA